MIWFNKRHPNAVYVDIRTLEKGIMETRPNFEIQPDKIMDFRSLDFPDKSFKLVVWDPPHLMSLTETSQMAKKYGTLNKETWSWDLKQGFKECWRVLEDYGVLIFKWSKADSRRKDCIPLQRVLKLFGEEPLFGHTTGSKSNTYWVCFMKIPRR